MKKLIVYGTLLQGENNFMHYSEGIEKIESCEITGHLFDTGWGFPAFVPDTKNGGKVYAELFTMTDRAWARIEMLEGYPHLYRRETIECKVGDRIENAPVYVMNRIPSRAREITKIGNWRTYRHGAMR